jgi:predicted Zn-dependent protease
MSFLMLTPDQVRELCGPGPVNTDDHPALELSTPKAMDRNKTWADNFAMLLSESRPKANDALLNAQYNQLIYQSDKVFTYYAAASKIGSNDYAEKQAVTYALEADNAVETLQELINNYPNEPMYRGLCATRLMMEGDYQTPLRILKPLEAKPDAKSAVLIAGAYTASADAKHAKAILDKVNPKTPEMLVQYANISASECNLKKTCEYLSDAVKLAPRRDSIRRLYADMLVKSGDVNSASQQFSILEKRTPADTEMLSSYAKLLDEMGRKSEAQRIRATIKLLGG